MRDVSAELRFRENVALDKLGKWLGVKLDPGKTNAALLEELAEAAETLLGPEIETPASQSTGQFSAGKR